MAISTVNASYLGQAPTKTGQILANALSGSDARTLYATATAISDGSDTNFTVNWIDGTQVLPFTPSAVLATRNGGTAAATISVLSVTSITTTSALITLSAAGSTSETFAIALAILK